MSLNIVKGIIYQPPLRVKHLSIGRRGATSVQQSSSEVSVDVSAIQKLTLDTEYAEARQGRKTTTLQSTQSIWT